MAKDKSKIRSISSAKNKKKAKKNTKVIPYPKPNK